MAKRIVWTQQSRDDVRRIGQPIALRILKTLSRHRHLRYLPKTMGTGTLQTCSWVSGFAAQTSTSVVIAGR